MAVRAMAAALLLGAGACEMPQPWIGDSPAAVETAPTPAAETAGTLPAEDAVQPLPAEPPPPPEVALTPSAPDGRAVTAPEVFPDPGDLLGLDGSAVAALLGIPALRRRDPPAELWQYRDEACILDLFLYQDQDGGAHAVTYFEVRGHSVVKVPAKDCLRALIEARRRERTGKQ